jgi:integrase
MPRKKVKRHANAHGEGSTFYDPKRQQWVSQLPAALAGKRILKRFDAEADALDWRLRELERLRSGRIGSDPSIPFGRYLRAWLDVHKVTLAQRTQEAYDQAVRSIGELAAIPLRDLTHRDFAALWAEMTNRGLKPSSIQLHRRVLRVALNAAMPDLIQVNPLLRAPAPRSLEQRVERWEDEDAARFLLAADQTEHFLYWRLALGIGARPSELRALHRSDFNAAEGTLLIERNLSDAGRIAGPTKTRRARTVHLPEPCLLALQAHLDRRADNSPWLFCHPPGGHLGGEPWGASHFSRHFAALLEAVTPSLPDILPYSLRHTCATAMLGHGIPVADVAYILGHSSPVTTMRIYARWLPSHRRRAAEVMAAVQPPFGAPEVHRNGASATTLAAKVPDS